VIIRKCRVVSLVSKILVAKAIAIANRHLDKRRATIVRNLKRRWAASLISNYVKRHLAARPNFLHANVRFGLTALVLCRSRATTEKRAADAIFQCLRDAEIVWSFKDALVQYWHRAQYVMRRFRITLEGRKNQMAELKDRFRQTQRAILLRLPAAKKSLSTGGKKSSEVSSQAVDKFADAIAAISEDTVTMTIGQYMDQCREKQRDNTRDLRKEKLEGKLSAFGVMMLQGGDASGSFEARGIPPELDRIYAMSQVGQNEDFICGQKHWKRIKVVLDALHKNYKKTKEQKLREITEFIGTSQANRVIY
jgi:hypothetical protein